MKFNVFGEGYNNENALFDIRFSYGDMIPEYKHSLNNLKIKYSGWTGKISAHITLKIVIFRFERYFSLEWDKDSVSPEEAYNIYHNKRK